MTNFAAKFLERISAHLGIALVALIALATTGAAWAQINHYKVYGIVEQPISIDVELVDQFHRRCTFPLVSFGDRCAVNSDCDVDQVAELHLGEDPAHRGSIPPISDRCRTVP